MAAPLRRRLAAVVTCVMLGFATFGGMQDGAAEAVHGFAWAHGDPSFYLRPAHTDDFLDRDCGDFANRAAAQGFLNSHVRPERDPHGLDRDDDLIACEGFPY